MATNSSLASMALQCDAAGPPIRKWSLFLPSSNLTEGLGLTNRTPCLNAVELFSLAVGKAATTAM